MSAAGVMNVRDYVSMPQPAQFAFDVADAADNTKREYTSVADAVAYETVTFDTQANAGRAYTSIAGAVGFDMTMLDSRDLQALSSAADPALFFMSPTDARSFEGEPVAEQPPAGVIVRTVVKRVAVPGQTRPSAQAILAAQRAGIDTTALGAPPAVPAPAIIVPAPVPIAPGPFPSVAAPVTPSPAPKADSTQHATGAIISQPASAQSSLDLQIANRTLARLTRELAQRDAEITELEGAVGAAFTAGMMAAEDG
jgi:hypothetical protein